ncbi:hypothetical protein QAD02_018338 [Eretmocerus hayati]|uniref:Uncharacterized protein n=1 Tax=Eretmocerus hayati TaxID=131215 RepID=A0ACC2PHN4_9HYME|nr:hypothetical protein QAD02_018338 [Eretmocerus hayati]
MSQSNLVVSPLIWDFCISVEQDVRCWNSTVSRDKYPFYAILEFIDIYREHPEDYGVIISTHYVLGITYVNQDSPDETRARGKVIISDDKDGESGNLRLIYDAEQIILGKNEMVSLFKLEKAIEFGPRVQPIRMFEAGQTIDPNDTVILSRLVESPHGSLERRVHGSNVTVISKEECKDMQSRTYPYYTNTPEDCETLIWIRDFESPCNSYRNDILIQRGQLAGLKAKFGYEYFLPQPGDHTKRLFYRAVDISLLRDAIREHTGF